MHIPDSRQKTARLEKTDGFDFFRYQPLAV